MLESTTLTLTVRRSRGVLLLTKSEYIKHHMNTNHSVTAEKTAQMWKTDLDNPDVHRDVEGGYTCISVRPLTTIVAEETRARSKQFQQVVDGDTRPL